jgi:diguanylate cyclase (GGDEF)-like protein
MSDAIPFEIARIQTILKYNGPRLRLPHDIEDIFKLQTEKSRRRGLVAAAYIGLIIFDFLILSDYMLISDVFEFCLIFRFGIITPLAVAVIVLVEKNISARFRECSQAALCAVAYLGLVCLEMASNELGRLYHHFGLIEILLYATILQRLRFSISIGLTITLYAMHLLLVAQFDMLTIGSKIALSLQIFSSFAIILTANYAGERWKRRQFLLTHLDHLRTLQMEHLAKHDTITKLPNRRALNEYIDVRSPIDSAVILIDIDYFKKYNDFYGHLGGDQCLRAVGEVLNMFDQCAGIVARYGGEEFILIIDGFESYSALNTAKAIRRRVSDLALPHEGLGRGARVTVSIGVASGRAHTDQEMLRLIRRADEALYDAKAEGRDRVCAYGIGSISGELSIAS